MPGATIDFIDIYTRLTDNERRRYEQEYPEESAEMAGFAERFREEGMQQGMQQGMRQGMQQGIQQGLLKGERTLLERQLRSRFGPLHPELLQKLEQASATELEQWAEDVLDAHNLDDVFHEGSEK